MLNGIAIRYYTLYTIHKPIAEMDPPPFPGESKPGPKSGDARETPTPKTKTETHISAYTTKRTRGTEYFLHSRTSQRQRQESRAGASRRKRRREMRGGRSMRGSKCKRPKDIRDHGNGEGEKTQTRETIRYHSLLRYAHARGGMPDHPGASQSIPGRHRG